MPANVKALRGVRPSKIHPEPVPRALGLDPPSWLSAAARAVWDDTEPDLDAMGLSRRADSQAFAAYCTAAALVAKLGEVLPATEGELRRWRIAAAELRAWAREFGLSPAARQGIRGQIPPPDPGRLLG